MSARASIKIETLLSGLTAAAGVAYCLGWLKTYYYFDAFGIGLSALEFSIQDYLFESWFVLENLVFFFLLFWFAAIRVRWWTIALLAVYGLIPIAAHYSFLGGGPSFLTAYRHTLLKFVPFAVFGIDWLVRRRSYSLAAWSWPYTNGALALFLIVTLSWGISAAKHFGSFDANRSQSSPDRFLPRAKVWLQNEGENPGQEEPQAAAGRMYLVHTSPSNYFLWQYDGFVFGAPDAQVHIVVLPKSSVRKIETWKAFQVQLGSIFF